MTLEESIMKKRKDYLEKKIKRELDIIKSKVRFILGILNDEIILKNKDEEEISEELEKMNFPKFTKGKLEYDQNNENSNPSYDYLIGMQIRAMTKKRVEELKQQEENKEGEYKEIINKTIYEMWNSDLDKIEEFYKKLP